MYMYICVHVHTCTYMYMYIYVHTCTFALTQQAAQRTNGDTRAMAYNAQR